MNRIALHILFLLLSAKGLGQVVKNTNLDLNTGGVVYDVIEAPAQDCYVVVGDFTSIGGVPRNNMAFIDRSTLSVSSDYIPISTVDGAIHTVTTHLGSFYIGGSFSQVNGVIRNGAARLNVLSGGSPGTVTSWDPDLYPSTVNDMMVHQSRIMIAGNFRWIDFNNNPSSRCGFASLHPANASADNFGASMPIASTGLSVNRIDTVDGAFFIAGKAIPGAPLNETFARLTSTGTIDPNFNPPDNGEVEAYSFTGDQRGRIHLIDAYASSIEQLAIDVQTGMSAPLSPTYPVGFTDAGTARDVLSYKDDIIRAFDGSNFNQLYAIDLDDPENPLWSVNTQSFPSPVHEKFWMVGNKLFVSSSSIISVDGAARQGLAVFCIEPFNPEGFVVFDSTVCPGQTIEYQIPPVSNADGYAWTYSGSGADISMNGDSAIFNSDTANRVFVHWLDGFSPGELTVRPFTNCDGTLIFAEEPTTINIGLNPLPPIDAGPDTTLTCDRDSVLLIGQSSATINQWLWSEYASFNDTLPLASTNNDSVIAHLPGVFVLEVEDPLGCINKDTLVVSMDTAKPNITIPPGPYTLTCAVDTLIVTGTSTTLNAMFSWRSMSTGNVIPNPLVASSIGSYMLRVIDPKNGCGDSLSISITLDTQMPDVSIQGHSGYNPAYFLDTITCDQDSIALTGISSTPNALVEWAASSDSLITITTPGTWWLQASDTVNGCVDSLGVQIAVDTLRPDASIGGYVDLSCSIDNAFAVPQSSYVNVTILPNDTIFYSDTGFHHFSVELDRNGCVNNDSFYVDRTSDITIDIGGDTLLCDHTILQVDAQYVGDIPGVEFSWNNGSSDSSSQFVSGVDTVAIVTVSNTSGCNGTDSLQIESSPPPTDSVSTFAPCGNDSTGQIIVELSGGLPPFLLSLNDTTTYQESTVFKGLPIGTYTVHIRDSLGCAFETITSITAGSTAPSTDFWIPTYNSIGDTIVMVDVSPVEVDSTEWGFPPELQVLHYSRVAPSVVAMDTGTFTVTMSSFIGDCRWTIMKSIVVSSEDSTLADLYNQNGIDTLIVYPNPNNGIFTIEVIFHKRQRSVLEVFDQQGNSWFRDEFEEVDHLIRQVDVSGNSGVYVVKIIGEFDGAHRVVIVKGV